MHIEVKNFIFFLIHSFSNMLAYIVQTLYMALFNFASTACIIITIHAANIKCRGHCHGNIRAQISMATSQYLNIICNKTILTQSFPKYNRLYCRRLFKNNRQKNGKSLQSSYNYWV